MLEVDLGHFLVGELAGGGTCPGESHLVFLVLVAVGLGLELGRGTSKLGLQEVLT